MRDTPNGDRRVANDTRMRFGYGLGVAPRHDTYKRIEVQHGAHPQRMWQLRVERELPAVLCAHFRGTDILCAMVRFRTGDVLEAVHHRVHTGSLLDQLMRCDAARIPACLEAARGIALRATPGAPDACW
jgi:hypothetical protein